LIQYSVPNHAKGTARDRVSRHWDTTDPVSRRSEASTASYRTRDRDHITDPNAMPTATTIPTVFEGAILGQRTLADAMEHREATTIGGARADLWTLLVDFQTGFPIVDPVGFTQRDAVIVSPATNRAVAEIVKSAGAAKQ
jgi:hypothetical protein